MSRRWGLRRCSSSGASRSSRRCTSRASRCWSSSRMRTCRSRSPTAATYSRPVASCSRARRVSCSRTKTSARRTLVGSAIRDRFPVFRDKVYVNSCSQGALSDAVRAAYEEYLDGWDENGAEWDHWVERSEAARAAFAGLLGAAPDDVAIQTSVSAAVSGLISALRFRVPRNRIVISENEFPTIGQIAHAQEL